MLLGGRAWQGVVRANPQASVVPRCMGGLGLLRFPLHSLRAQRALHRTESPVVLARTPSHPCWPGDPEEAGFTPGLGEASGTAGVGPAREGPSPPSQSWALMHLGEQSHDCM